MSESRVALVTGASRGIGQAAAIEIARSGAHVVLLARSSGGLQATDDAIRALNGTASILQLDLMKGAEVDLIGPTLLQRFGRLDAWVSAAAWLPSLTPMAHTTDADWSTVTTIMLDANRRLIRTLDPLLRRSPAGRAVFITPRDAREPAAYWGAYAVANAGVEAMARLWSLETATTSLRVSLFTAPPTATLLRRRAFPGEKPESLATPADSATRIAELAGDHSAIASTMPS